MTITQQIKKKVNNTKPIKILQQEGMRDLFSTSTKSEARLCVGQVGHCEIDYRLNNRAMVRKMPGFYYTSAYRAQFASKGLISEPQYMGIL